MRCHPWWRCIIKSWSTTNESIHLSLTLLLVLHFLVGRDVGVSYWCLLYDWGSHPAPSLLYTIQLYCYWHCLLLPYLLIRISGNRPTPSLELITCAQWLQVMLVIVFCQPCRTLPCMLVVNNEYVHVPLYALALGPPSMIIWICYCSPPACLCLLHLGDIFRGPFLLLSLSNRSMGLRFGILDYSHLR